MRSRQLEAALREFVEEAAQALQAEILAGAEVPFELASQASRRGQTPLYCYRPLMRAFLRERSPLIVALPGYGRARALIDGLPGLERYLSSGDGTRVTGGASAALAALLEDVFEEQSDFEISPLRLDTALARLDRFECAIADEVSVVATLHGLTIASPELQLTPNLLIAQPDALSGAPEQAIFLSSQAGGRAGHARHLLACFTIETQEDPTHAITEGRKALRGLLRALRLFGDGRIALGPLAWTRAGEGTWLPVAPGWGGRPHGMLLVSSEHEDELRAFCNLVIRRAPQESELAWALRRFELGCERVGEHEALSDYLLALRALLDPERGGDGLLAARIGALCATQDRRAELTGRIIEATELERQIIEGRAPERTRGTELIREIAGHLRALLRDVLCGHLDSDLVSVADELLQASQEAPVYSEHEEAAAIL